MPKGHRRGRRAIHGYYLIGGNVPGAAADDTVQDDDDPVDRDGVGGSVPGAAEGDTVGDDDEREDALKASVPKDDDRFDPALLFAAALYEPPAPISATAARAASGFSFLLMFHSFVW